MVGLAVHSFRVRAEGGPEEGRICRQLASVGSWSFMEKRGSEQRENEQFQEDGMDPGFGTPLTKHVTGPPWWSSGRSQCSGPGFHPWGSSGRSQCRGPGFHPWWSSGRSQCRGPGFDPWLGN